MISNHQADVVGDSDKLIEQALRAAMDTALSPAAPAHLRGALDAAVFPGGSRMRPKLCLKVSYVCGEKDPELATRAAAAIELLHCASLVHDDLPCFDNAALRRGRPTVHRLFGEPIAVLTGDALIVMAFKYLSLQAALTPELGARMIEVVAEAVGPSHGLIAGQSMEAMTHVPIDRYHHYKTGSLFVAAATCGALASGADPAPWSKVGELLGHAYQIADDIADTVGRAEVLGKLPAVDTQLNRPSIVRGQGLDSAAARFYAYLEQIGDAIPASPQKRSFVDWLNHALCKGVAGPGKAGLIQQTALDCAPL
ncbi:MULTISPECIES: polyprenyl synthetase family protein [Rhizobium]|uniref:Geranylgeranyl pyrophosphate synthase n=4 Tax=Rhizobium TaxID=379 RepID=A0A1L5PBW4_RHIET|nr:MULTISPECIES: polyprenyl synthetase family protein [Rhizobium]EGE60211.1 farnesyltranstransferase protein [Rhizobium etli CNPAF512]APO77632.1 geranylgeranyl pyrophosphate synthase [Rhizobium etli 8C-3]MBB5668147.1 geranylgeranyl diphosphate synthase type II [Rhizobium leguminosarum]MBB6225407.1 geranylgeranyl diphosphate synthase type II [Rhizobium leguminosarum]MBY4593493.1 polyprenyl synthetase family protein [Rhizobium redzepovicii]